MEPEPLYRLIETLSTLAGSAAGLSDVQLLERIVTGRDEAAFELLLWRHGAMVLGVCRRTLRDSHAAEDAFQATFMILARKASSVGRGEAVGAWLAKVAYRVALRARAELAKQAQRQQQATEQIAAPRASDPERDELRQVLDEEIDRLPARQRAVVVLCCFEGKTGEQAARELGCAAGTVSSRLTRARERLRRRLARRGLLPAEPLPEVSRQDALQATLVGRTLESALAFAARGAGTLSGRPLDYAEGVLRAMFVNKMKTVALLALLTGVLIVGGFATGHALDASAPPQTDRARADKGEQAKQKERPAQAVRVLKPQAGGIARTTNLSCTVQAFEQEQMFPAVSGTLKSLDVDVGDAVKKGQVLGVIDAPLLVIAEKEAVVGVRLAKGKVQEAQANVAALKADVEVAKTAILQRKTDVDVAKATLTFEERGLARLAVLLQNKAVDKKVVEEKEQVVQTAKARLAVALAAIENAKAESEVKRSKVAQAEAAVSTAKAMGELADLSLEKARYYSTSLARLVAAFDGVVTERNASTGQRLQAGETSGRPSLLTVQRTDKVRLVANVAENDAALVRAGVSADVEIHAYPNDVLKDRTVSRVGSALNPRTGTMRVEIDVANPKQQLRPGMTGTATVQLGKPTPGALRLPTASLARRTAKAGVAVYVVRDGKARRTPVKLGHRGGKEIEITSGLKATDLVVADPTGFTEEVVPVEVK